MILMAKANIVAQILRLKLSNKRKYLESSPGGPVTRQEIVNMLAGKMDYSHKHMTIEQVVRLSGGSR